VKAAEFLPDLMEIGLGGSRGAENGKMKKRTGLRSNFA